MKISNALYATTIAALMAISAPSSATLLSGDTARTQFEGFVTTLGDTYENFDGFAAQTNLTTQIPGLTFRTTVDGTGYHLPPPGGSRGTPVDLEVNVICSRTDPFSSTCSDSNRMIGGVRSGGVTDGQSIYEIAFDSGQLRVGMLRSFFGDLQLTRFYSGSDLLGEYQNTGSDDFVGFITDAAHLITRVELDGLPTYGTNGYVTYNVGYTDDLFYGNTPQSTGVGTVPEPTTQLLLLPGLLALAMRRKLGSATTHKNQAS
jgi:hypothetical protein